MSERNVHRVQEAGQSEDRFSEGGMRAPAHYSRLRKLWWWFDFHILVKLARLRFLAVLTAIGLLIIHWDTLVAYYEKWTRPLSGTEQVADSDTEYFCPMHPQVVTSNPKEKSPICFINLTSWRLAAAATRTSNAWPVSGSSCGASSRTKSRACSTSKTGLPASSSARRSAVT